MKLLFYSVKDFEISFLKEANKYDFEIRFTDLALSARTAAMAAGYDAISIFTNDDASAPVLQELAKAGVRFIGIRATGYDNINLNEAQRVQIKVTNVPDYSPYAIAEHAIALMLALNRKLITSNQQVHDYNFSLSDLIGFDLHGKKVGVVGTGKIGSVMCKILHGFGCKILAYDVIRNNSLVANYDVLYVGLNTLCSMADIITIHVPLTTDTKYLINRFNISMMKPGVMLINTSRGAVVNTEDVLWGLDNNKISYYGMDVYEKEKGVFFYDCSKAKPKDDLLNNLMGRTNVLITPHQAFATKEALTNIAQTTFDTIHSWKVGRTLKNELTYSGEVNVEN